MGRIVLEKVTKKFGETEVIPPLDLTIEDGEFAVFVGPSGCGKSTLLRLIAGLEETTSGRVLIDDQDMTEVSPSKRGLAMVFQSYALYPHLSVYENIAFPLRVQKKSKAGIEAGVMEAARILQLEERLSYKPGALSGGMAQRVARKLGKRAQDIIWREVTWADILQKRQREYLDLIRDKTGSDPARAFVLSALSDAASYRKVSDGSAAIYEQIHSRVELTMRALAAEIGPDGPVLILAHSLGAQLAA